MSERFFPDLKKRTENFDCSLGFAMTVIGSKWRAVILWHIIKASPVRYGELKQMVPGISHKVFTEELKHLEADHLISRTAYPTIPPKVEYAVTDLGLTLKPALEELCSWGKRFTENAEPD